jgi:small GTP-binding protein
MVKGISGSDIAVPGERLTIGIFGKRNAGKSSLFNLLLGQDYAVVSSQKGTTTDPVRKAMELEGIGAVTLIDTPGYDDGGTVGSLRVEQTLKSAAGCDVALMITDGREDVLDRRWAEYLEARGATVVTVSKEEISENGGFSPAARETVFSKIKAAIDARNTAEAPVTILGGLVGQGDTVVLVMPQDKAAPKGRLIMPQMQTIRELLDRKCIPVCVVPENLPAALGMFPSGPALVITDSQAFAAVRKAMSDVFGKRAEAGASATKAGMSARESVAGNTDAEVISDVIGGVPLTSFSILFSRYKGDIRIFREGALAIDSLGSGSSVLIAEACSHRPLSEDIGRVKLPALLRKKAGDGIVVDVVAGADWPSDLGGYDLIIHCGACMFNRRLVLSRIAEAQAAGVPITNYGLAISRLATVGK